MVIIDFCLMLTSETVMENTPMACDDRTEKGDF